MEATSKPNWKENKSYYRKSSFKHEYRKKFKPFKTRKKRKQRLILKTTNDPIADLLVRLRNGGMKKKDSVKIPFSKEKDKILELLRNEHYINHYDVKEDERKRKYFIVYLKYYGSFPSIKGLRRISKPGLRIYSKSKDLPKVLKGLGIAIISTSKGIMTDERARSQNIGGEIIAYIW